MIFLKIAIFGTNVMSDRIAILILVFYFRGYPPSGFMNMLQQPQLPPPPAGEFPFWWSS
jgi:hypothetical protein